MAKLPPPPNEPTRLGDIWLTAKKIARELGTCTKTIYNWRKAGKLVYVQRGRFIYYNYEDVHNMLYADRQLDKPKKQRNGVAV